MELESNNSLGDRARFTGEVIMIPLLGLNFYQGKGHGSHCRCKKGIAHPIVIILIDLVNQHQATLRLCLPPTRSTVQPPTSLHLSTTVSVGVLYWCLPSAPVATWSNRATGRGRPPLSGPLSPSTFISSHLDIGSMIILWNGGDAPHGQLFLELKFLAC